MNNKNSNNNNNNNNNKKHKPSVSHPNEPPAKKLRNIIYTDSVENLPPPDPQVVNTALLQDYEPDQRDEIAANYNYLRTKYRLGTKIAYYHLRLKDISLNIQELENFIQNIYKTQKTAFKIQISFSVLLQHRETKEFRVFLGHVNSMAAFTKPMTVSSWSDMSNVLDKIQENDLHEIATLNRPNTRYVIIGFLTAQINIYKFSQTFPIVGSMKKLPEYLKKNKNILCYTYEGTTNTCLFACIAGFLLGYKKMGIVRKTAEQKRQWEKYKRIRGNFDGRISLTELDEIERCFDVRINVYKLVPCKKHKPSDKKKNHRVETVRLSGYGSKSTPVLSLDYYAKAQHFSLIKNLKKYISVYKCVDCGYLVSKEFKLRKHMLRAKCANNKDPKPKYLGGSFGGHNLTIWRKLELRGIKVGKEKFNSGFSIWDFESITINNPIKCGKNLILEGTLVPISCAVCSTDPHFRESKFFIINNDTSDLIDRILGYLLKVQQAAYSKRTQELNWVFDNIDCSINQLRIKIGDEGVDEEMLVYIESQIKIWNQLREELDRHCSEHVVFGWNSAKFDINLIRSELFSSFDRKKIPFSYMVKKQATYAYIKAGPLVFRDAQHLVSPGISLKKFLLSQRQDNEDDFQGKLIFPHDWLQNLSQLYTQTNFPDKSCFYTKLRNENVTDTEYEESKKLFAAKKCENMSDWLKIYNIADCYELRNAMERLQIFWQNLGFSILFDGISLSALAEKVLHSTIVEPCHLWIPSNYRDKVIYDEINKSIVGGPSIGI